MPIRHSTFMAAQAKVSPEREGRDLLRSRWRRQGGCHETLECIASETLDTAGARPCARLEIRGRGHSSIEGRDRERRRGPGRRFDARLRQQFEVLGLVSHAASLPKRTTKLLKRRHTAREPAGLMQGGEKLPSVRRDALINSAASIHPQGRARGCDAARRRCRVLRTVGQPRPLLP